MSLVSGDPYNFISQHQNPLFLFWYVATHGGKRRGHDRTAVGPDALIYFVPVFSNAEAVAAVPFAVATSRKPSLLKLPIVAIASTPEAVKHGLSPCAIASRAWVSFRGA